MGRKLTITIGHDDSPECPNEWGGWKLVSFNSRHVNFEDPYKYLGPPDEYGNPTPANIGIARKLECETAFVVSCYEHGSSHWGLPGEVMQCRFDTAQVAGILVWEDKPSNIDPEARVSSARFALATYTSWCNGNIYGFMIDTHDEDDEGESHWGYYEGDEDDMMEDIASCLEPDDEIEIIGDAKHLTEYHPLPVASVA